jgi:hypothetical protein
MMWRRQFVARVLYGYAGVFVAVAVLKVGETPVYAAVLFMQAVAFVFVAENLPEWWHRAERVANRRRLRRRGLHPFERVG